MLVTNLTELIGREELCALLRLCGTEEDIFKHGSDYELFLAFCGSVPLLKGHSFPQSLQCFLKERFAVTQPLTPENAAAVWHEVAKMLLMHPTASPANIERQKPTGWDLPPLIPIPNALLWRMEDAIETEADSWSVWEAEMRQAVDEKEKRGVSCIVLPIIAQTCSQRPNLFRVNLSLQAKPRSAEDLAVLYAQRVRFFCIQAQKRGMTLILHLAADCPEPVGFLAWLEQTVGLPSLLAVETAETRASLMRLAMQEHCKPIGLAIDSARYPAAAFEREVRELAKRYPLGCLSVLDGDRLCRFAISE